MIKLAEGESEESVVRITAKDLPLSRGNTGIKSYLISQERALTSKITCAKAQNEKKTRTYRLAQW